MKARAQVDWTHLNACMMRSLHSIQCPIILYLARDNPHTFVMRWLSDWGMKQRWSTHGSGYTETVSHKSRWPHSMSYHTCAFCFRLHFFWFARTTAVISWLYQQRGYRCVTFPITIAASLSLSLATLVSNKDNSTCSMCSGPALSASAELQCT